MTKIGNQGGASGRVGWGSRSSNSTGNGAGNGSGMPGSVQSFQEQAFKRVIDDGARQLHKKNEREDGTVNDLDQSLAKSGAEPTSLATPRNLATYETTKIVEMQEFLQQFPESKATLQPVIDQFGTKFLPTIAIVNSSHNGQGQDVQSIGNTIFVTGQSANDLSNGSLTTDTLDSLTAALGKFIGGH